MELLSQANGEWLPVGAAASMIGVSRQALFKVAPRLLRAGAAYQRCNGRWMFCRSTVVDVYRDQTRPRSDSPIERDHRWMNGADAARFLQLSSATIPSQYCPQLIDAGVAKRNGAGQVLFLRSEALEIAFDAARDSNRAALAERRADASNQRRRHFASIAATCAGGQWRTRIDFAGMVFPLQASADDYHLGALCNNGHAWPGTCQSLRRADYRAPVCRACMSRRGGTPWWLPFVDWPDSPVPAGFKLGKLCPNGHEWNGAGVTLRRLGDGKCPECEKIRLSSPERLAAVRAWHAQKRLDPQWVAKERRRSVQKWRSYSAEQKEKKNQCNVRRRAAFKAQGLTTNGTAPSTNTGPYVEHDLKALRAWLRKPSLSPSVVRLVDDERRRHFKVCPEDRRAHVNAAAKQRWQFNYLTDELLRLRTREKSKRRKASERKVWLCKVKASDIRARYAEFGHRCAYCGAGGNLHMDHFIPLAKKGPHVLGNLIPACQECNYSKRDRDPEQWYKAQPFFSEARWRKILRVLGKRKCDPGQLSMW
jgi:5-methylcytosine-specific restriction endonuclease McrA